MPNPFYSTRNTLVTWCICTVALVLGSCFSAHAIPDYSEGYIPPEDSAPVLSSPESLNNNQRLDESSNYQQRREQKLHRIAYDNLPDTDKLNDNTQYSAPFVASPRYALPVAATPSAPVAPLVALAPPQTIQPVTLAPAAVQPLPVQEVSAPPPIAPMAASVPQTPPVAAANVLPPKQATHGILASFFSKNQVPIAAPSVPASSVGSATVPASVTPVSAPAVVTSAATPAVTASATILSNSQLQAAAANEKTLAALTPAAGGPLPFSGSAATAPPAAGAVTPAAQTDTPAPVTLSDSSKHIADALPPEKPVVNKVNPMVTVEHFRKNPLDDDTEVKEHEGVGIKISVRSQKANVTQMLEQAYDALIAGNQEEAISLYKQVLEIQPDNRLGLFGLATTYHRAGQLQLARPLYGKLLAIDPGNKEGLNNFLVLLSDESPSAALVELGKLEKTHPGFSPVPAQMAVIYEKTGDYTKATEMMNRAIEMSPANLKYRYDMAIILDKQGAWKDAATMYQQLIAASERGEKIPANVEEIQERLTFIRSNRPKA